MNCTRIDDGVPQSTTGKSCPAGTHWRKTAFGCQPQLGAAYKCTRKKPRFPVAMHRSRLINKEKLLKELEPGRFRPAPSLSKRCPTGIRYSGWPSGPQAQFSCNQVLAGPSCFNAFSGGYTFALSVQTGAGPAIPNLVHDAQTSTASSFSYAQIANGCRVFINYSAGPLSGNV